MKPPRIGIVGGVGPLAAAHFYQRVIQLSPASCDEDHFPAVLISDRIPSRIAHLLGGGPDPVPALQRVVRQLVAADVDLVTVPSATTTAYIDDLRAMTDLPVVDLLVETGRAIEAGGYQDVVVLATRPTARLRLYERSGTVGRVRYPDEQRQCEVDRLIDAVKAGAGLEDLRAQLHRLAASFAAGPATAVLLGCTELGVIAPAPSAGPAVIDAADVLARSVVERCLALVSVPASSRPPA